MSAVYGVGQHPGIVEEEREVGPFRVTRTYYPRRERIGVHSHARAQVYFVIAGGFCDFGPWDKVCRAGASVYLPAGVGHAQEMFPVGARCLNVEIDTRWLAEMLGGDGAEELGRARVLSTHDSIAARRLERALSQSEVFARAHTAALVLDRIALALTPSSSRLADKAAGWLRERWAHASIADLARDLRVNPGHLARVFRARFGVTPRAYLARLRVDHACELLRAGVAPRRAARACGYADTGHLAHATRHHLGFTPSQLAQDPDPGA